MLRLHNLSENIVQELREAVAHLIPDGGPLDDEWPDCSSEIALLVTNKFPLHFNVRDDGFAIADDLIVDAMCNGEELESESIFRRYL